MKTKITNISSVGIIYRAGNPSNIFIEVKDDGHPIKLVRRQLCPIGGNWIGKAAARDINTFMTFARELDEELSFDRPVRNSVELAQMDMAVDQTFAPTPIKGVEATKDDRLTLQHLKDAILVSAVAFGDYLNTVPKAALDAADPANKRDGFTTLVSYWLVRLVEDDWRRLCSLQSKFGNLSNESLALVTSLDEIIQTNTKTAFAHDRVLQEFFYQFGYTNAEQFPLVPGLESVRKRTSPFSSYAEYLDHYDVAKMPPPF